MRKKKVGKEIAPHSLRPFASLRATCDARPCGGAAELATFFELRSNSCGKPDHEVRVSFGTRTHPRPCASRRSQKGWERGHGRLLLRSCALGRFALRAADMLGYRSGEPSAAKDHRPSEAMARMEPVPPPPLLTVLRSAEAGVARVPKDTRASSSDSPQMSERSSQNAASCEAHPSFEHRRLPPRPRRGGHGQRGRLFLAYFFWRDKRR